MKYYFIILLFISISAKCQENIFGCYTSKTAELEMYMTRIQLNNDWTFKYEFAGDLTRNWGDGEFSIDTDQVVMLNFGKSDFDSLKTLTQSLSGGNEVFGSMFYVYKRNRLYPLKSNGKLDKKNYLIKADIDWCDKWK